MKNIQEIESVDQSKCDSSAFVSGANNHEGSVAGRIYEKQEVQRKIPESAQRSQEPLSYPYNSTFGLKKNYGKKLPGWRFISKIISMRCCKEIAITFAFIGLVTVILFSLKDDKQKGTAIIN